MSPSSGDPFPGARVIAESGTCAECGRDVYVGDIHFCGQAGRRLAVAWGHEPWSDSWSELVARTMLEALEQIDRTLESA